MLLELRHWRNSPRGRGLRRLADLVGGFGDRDGRNLRSGARADRLLQRFLNGNGIAECRQSEIIKTRAADFDATVIKDAPKKSLTSRTSSIALSCRSFAERRMSNHGYRARPLIGDADFRGPDAVHYGNERGRRASHVTADICDEDKQSEDGPSQPTTNGWKARPIRMTSLPPRLRSQIAHRSTFSSIEAQKIRRLLERGCAAQGSSEVSGPPTTGWA